MKRAASIIALALAAFGTWQVASAAWIRAKALLAQQLLCIAWERTQLADAPQRPWPGADLRPVAKLTVPSRRVSVYVLDDAHARALAFGPAHLDGTANPGDSGNSVIVAHRDTHFAFLRDVAMDDEIDIETARGVRVRYRVREAFVVDKADMQVAEPIHGTRLTLVTCWPFDAIRPGTPLRYVVVAERVDEPGDAPRSPLRGA